MTDRRKGKKWPHLRDLREGEEIRRFRGQELMILRSGSMWDIDGVIRYSLLLQIILSV